MEISETFSDIFWFRTILPHVCRWFASFAMDFDKCCGVFCQFRRTFSNVARYSVRSEQLTRTLPGILFFRRSWAKHIFMWIVGCSRSNIWNESDMVLSCHTCRTDVPKIALCVRCGAVVSPTDLRCTVRCIRFRHTLIAYHTIFNYACIM